jgi:hypothetical protein
MSGGSLEFYLAGTTTATDLYSDNAGTSIGVSIALNSAGFPESGGNTITLFRDQSKALKIVGKDAVGSTIFTSDNIPAVASFDSASSAKLDLITVTDAVNLDTLASGSYLPLAGGTLTGNLTMGAGTFQLSSVSAGITASTTQAQGEGVLFSEINEVSICATTNDTVTLPSAVAGLRCVVINNGANTLQIFPAADDNINSLGVDVATTAASGDNINFVAYDSTNWEAI